MTEQDKILHLKERAQQTVFVFLYGLKSSGKSAMLAAMFHALNTNHHLGTILPLGTYVSDPSIVDNQDLFETYREVFAEGNAFPERTDGDYVREISIRYTPFNKAHSPVNITFLEISGEALESIKVINQGNLPADINIYFKIPNIRMVFLLVGEFVSFVGQNPKMSVIPKLNPDSYISSFLDHIQRNGTDITIADFLLVVTKWDKSKEVPSERFENHIRKNYRATLNRITKTLKKSTNGAMPFSVGNVINTDGGEMITNFNPSPSYKIWKWIYERATNKKKTWWQKLWDFLTSI